MESPIQSTDIAQSYKLSWTAYVGSAVFLLFMLFIGLIIAQTHLVQALVFVSFWLCLFAYKLLMMRSVVLYTDPQGVWVYSGILPWQKGINGVKWRDVEDAVYMTGFSSWIFKSYTVRIGHRFTKSSEIVLTSINRGDQAVMHINEYHQRILSSGASE